jgi:hypothetical protein
MIMDFHLEVESLAGKDGETRYAVQKSKDVAKQSLRQQQRLQRQMMVDLISADMFGSFRGCKHAMTSHAKKERSSSSSSVVSSNEFSPETVDYSIALDSTKTTATSSIIAYDELIREGLTYSFCCDSSDVESVWSNDDDTAIVGDCDYSIALQSYKNTATASVKGSMEQYLHGATMRHGNEDPYCDTASFEGSVATNDVRWTDFADDAEDVSTISTGYLNEELGFVKAGVLRTNGAVVHASCAHHELLEVVLLPTQSKNKRVRGGSIISSSDGTQSAVTVDEIKQDVLEALPDHIKNCIPRSAWDKIFQYAVSDSSSESDSTDVDHDDFSIMSDVTGTTGVYIIGPQSHPA